MIQIKATGNCICVHAHKQEGSPNNSDGLNALAEPTRLGVMRLLHEGAEHCVCGLIVKLEASQSRMSRHMKVLRDADLVVDRRDEQWVRYRRNRDLTGHASVAHGLICLPFWLS